MTDSAAIDPLVPYTDIVSSSSTDSTDGALGISGATAVGLNTSSPLSPLSQQAWELMHPQDQANYLADALTGGDDDDEGNFNPDAQLDTTQVLPGNTASEMGVGTPAPPTSPIPSTRPPQQGVDGIPMSADGPTYSGDQKPRFDDIGYRVSELWKGIKAGPFPKANANEHLMNFLDPDRNLPSGEVPATAAQLGIPTPGGPRQPQAVAAPTGFYSTNPSEWKYVSDDPTRVQAILDVANSMVGRSDAPVDLVRRAYAEAGIELPTLPDFQLDMGQSVPLNKLKPGDLVGWSANPDNPLVSNIGIMLMDGKVIKAGSIGEGPRVFNLYNLPRNSIFGARIPSNNGGNGNGGSVSLSAPSVYAQNAAQAAVAAVQKLIGGIFGDMKKDDNKGGKNGGGNGGGGGKPSGQGSKYYGSDQKNTNNSSHHYTGIGATK